MTITVDVTSPAQIARLELFVYEYLLEPSGADLVATRRTEPAARWGSVWAQEFARPLDVERAHVQIVLRPFGSASYVFYIAQATDRWGRTFADAWGFAAGAWPAPHLPVPLWRNERPACGISVAFVATLPDFSTPRAMLPPLAKLIFEGYHSNNGIRLGRRYWQFYYAADTAATATIENGRITSLRPTPQSVVNGATLQAIGFVHDTPSLPDKKGHLETGTALFTTAVTTPGTAIHETGHAIFGLADEYEGGTPHLTPGIARPGAEPTPLNVYASRDTCDRQNAGQRLPPCEEIGDTDIWRSERSSGRCVMLDDGDFGTPPFGPTCLARIRWYYEDLASRQDRCDRGGVPVSVPERIMLFSR